MTDKPVQARLKAKKPSRNKSAIRIPISLHFYAVEIVVIILAVFIINIYIQSIFKDYIQDQCNSRLDKAVESTVSLTHAFTLQLDPDDDESPMVPAVDRSKCIGCGACEYLCPARPFSAIYVEGNEAHSSL